MYYLLIFASINGGGVTRTQIKTTIKNLNRFLVIALFIFRLFYKQLEGLEMGIKQKMDFGLPKFTSIYFVAKFICKLFCVVFHIGESVRD